MKKKILATLVIAGLISACSSVNDSNDVDTMNVDTVKINNLIIGESEASSVKTKSITETTTQTTIQTDVNRSYINVEKEKLSTDKNEEPKSSLIKDIKDSKDQHKTAQEEKRVEKVTKIEQEEAVESDHVEEEFESEESESSFFSWFNKDSKRYDNLKKQLELQGITIKNGYKTLPVEFKENIMFDLQKSDLKPRFIPTIEALANFIKEIEENITIEIVGHTDYTGPERLNTYLGKERATIVGEKLIEFGVNPDKIVEIRGVKAKDIKDGCIQLQCMRQTEIILHKNDILFELK